MTDAEKMQKLEEAMNNFLSNVAQRAETAKEVKEVTEEYPDSFDDFPDYSEDESEPEEIIETPTDFSSDEEDDLPLTKEQEQAFNTEDWKKAWVDSMYATKAFYDSEKQKQKAEEERKSTKQPKQCNDTVMYRKNVATFNGRPFEYKVLQKEADWGTAFTKAFTMNDKITNLDELNKKLIEDIKLNFGDLTRITEVAVISGMLIINGVQYYPLCNDKDFLNGLPFDCADYFKSGLIAEIFDFGYLSYMPYLTSLKIDSVEFVVRKFAYDIGITGQFKVPLVFKKFKNLKLFELADTCFQAPGVDVNAEVEESIERQSRAAEIYDNYIVNNASTFSKWTFNNLKQYACNRGDKGLFRYTGGVLARGVISATAGVGELGTRTIGAVVKGGAKLLKNAFSGDI